MLKEFDKLENFIFDFVPFTEAGEQKDSKLEPQEAKDLAVANDLKTISTSYKNIYCDETRKNNYKEQKAAYKLSAEHFERLILIEDTDAYEEQFKAQRDKIFSFAAKVLFSINKKGFLNSFNLKYLSMPIEHSLQHNYWSYQVIKMYLGEQQKAKTMIDIGTIAQVNQINVLSLAQSAMNMAEYNQSSGQDLINITQGSAHGQGAGHPSSLNVKAQHQNAKKFNQFFNDLFILLSNTENPDRRCKQSLLRGTIQQLDHQEFVYKIQIRVFQEIMN